MFIVPTTIPSNFLTYAVTSTVIKLSWDPPPLYFQNGVITSYTLTYRGIQRDTTLETVNVSVVNGTYVLPILTGLEEYTDYLVEVSANTINGTGPPAASYQLTPQDGNFLILLLILYNQSNILTLVPSGAPRSLSLSTTDTSIQVNWSVPLINDLNGILTGYVVTYYGYVIDTEEREEPINTSTEVDQNVTLYGLQEYTDYFISVQAVTVGRGPSISNTTRTLQKSKFCSYQVVYSQHPVTRMPVNSNIRYLERIFISPRFTIRFI